MTMTNVMNVLAVVSLAVVRPALEVCPLEARHERTERVAERHLLPSVLRHTQIPSGFIPIVYTGRVLLRHIHRRIKSFIELLSINVDFLHHSQNSWITV